VPCSSCAKPSDLQVSTIDNHAIILWCLGGLGGRKPSHTAAHMLRQHLSATADLVRLTSLTQLTHLDLGYAHGAMSLAQQLPNLHSLALQIPSSHLVVSAA
jgi:hypothetical protein